MNDKTGREALRERLDVDEAAMTSVEAMLSAYLLPNEAARAANDVVAKLRLGGFVLSRASVEPAPLDQSAVVEAFARFMTERGEYRGITPLRFITEYAAIIAAKASS